MISFFTRKKKFLNHDVKKVSSGFEYFLLIFSLRLGLILKVVEMDAELNSLSNGGSKKVSSKFLVFSEILGHNFNHPILNHTNRDF
jgi:hypothetical protein